MNSYKTDSPRETFDLGCALGRVLCGGQTVALVGQLGAGKTQLVKGVAVGNGLADPGQVTSPTFVLVNEYVCRLHLYHVDLYRLRGEDELFALGFEEMTVAGSAALVEWADRAPGAMPPDTLWIQMEVTGENDRSITFRATGAKAERTLRALRKALR